MAKWIIPSTTKGKVNRAGKLLAEGSLLSGLPPMEIVEVMSAISNWRSSHSYPQHIAKKTLQKRAKKLNHDAICFARLKRLPSILTKLRRNAHMTLTQMQDIGGCRAVMPTYVDLLSLIAVHEDAIKKNPPRKEKEKRVTRSGFELVERYDYLTNPKSDGYRSFHYVFRYLSIYKQEYNGLRIEVQLRTQLQHFWATAVEAVSIFTEQALKTGLGRPEWRRFFALIGSAFAMREGCPLVPDTPTDPAELVTEIKGLYDDLQVDMVLRGITATVEMREQYGAEAFLLVLDAKQKKLDVKGFKADELGEANQEYLLVEQRFVDDPSIQAVLVSIDSLDTLANAYPNYYLDTAEFLNLVSRVITEDPYAYADTQMSSLPVAPSSSASPSA